MHRCRRCQPKGNRNSRRHSENRKCLRRSSCQRNHDMRSPGASAAASSSARRKLRSVSLTRNAWPQMYADDLLFGCSAFDDLASSRNPVVDRLAALSNGRSLDTAIKSHFDCGETPLLIQKSINGGLRLGFCNNLADLRSFLIECGQQESRTSTTKFWLENFFVIPFFHFPSRLRR